MVKEAGLILEPPPRYRYSMGQEQSQPEAEKQAHRFSFYRPSHIRSHSMVESTSTMQQNSQHRPQVSIPPVYSPTDLVLNRGSGETSRPISPPALVDNTPPVPPVNPARQQRRPAMNPPVTGTGHRRHESAGEIMTHHTFGCVIIRGRFSGGYWSSFSDIVTRPLPIDPHLSYYEVQTMEAIELMGMPILLFLPPILLSLGTLQRIHWCNFLDMIPFSLWVSCG